MDHDNTANNQWDGRLSVEHQLDIHINDLLQYGENVPEANEILRGLRYVMDYRIRGFGHRVVSEQICDRLARVLLLYTSQHERKGLRFFGRRIQFTMIANQAFSLLVDFAMELEQFGQVLAKIPAEYLIECLYLKDRLLASEEISKDVARLLKLLFRSKPQEYNLSRLFRTDDISVVSPALEKAGYFSEDQEQHSTTEMWIHPPPALYFDLGTERLLDMFRTDISTGLVKSYGDILKDIYGPNVVPTHESTPFWEMLANQFFDWMIMILILTTIVSALVDYPDLESSIVLATVVILNVGFGFWQELRSSKTVAAMRSLQIPSARVRRDGKNEVISSSGLVPGDVVLLNEGDAVPADLRIIEANSLYVNEVILTGESEPVEKDCKPIRFKSRKLQLTECKGNAFMGTVVGHGTGIGVVVRTGSNTEIGKIGAALNVPSERIRSPLHRKLAYLTRLLVFAAIALCSLVAIMGILQGEDAQFVIRLSISLAVSVIPEGLVAILTVTLALAVNHLARKKALVRRLDAVETLGSTTVIGADKTGTITEGKMRFHELWVVNESLRDTAIDICVYCNNATWETGEPTERALIQGLTGKRSRLLLAPERVWEIPFDSDRRLMSVVMRELTGELKVYTKGACEAVLEKCHPASIDSIIEKIEAQENVYSDDGMRVLALARRSISAVPMEGSINGDAIESDLDFVGLVSLSDPPRAGVADSIRLCQQAGIQVCMITGDHARTALSIARQVGIKAGGGGSRLMLGRDLDVLSAEALASLRPFPTVFARVSPSNKLAIVKALQHRGETVLMTGDGVNDAPALRQADVGVAMGGSGTQITRDAAAIILLDDNFATIVGSIVEGRQVFRNIRLFLIYLLSCNSAEIWTVLITMAAGWDPPFSPINILWANIIADIPPSMSLGLEHHSPDDLMSTPTKVTLNILGFSTWILIFVNGFVMSLLTTVIYVMDLDKPDITRRSEAFTMLIGLQLMLALVSRSPSESALRMGITGNRWLVVSVILSFVLLIAGIYVSFLSELLDLEPVSWLLWMKFLVAAFVTVLANELTKWGIRKQHRSTNTTTQLLS